MADSVSGTVSAAGPIFGVTQPLGQGAAAPSPCRVAISLSQNSACILEGTGDTLLLRSLLPPVPTCNGALC